VELQATTRTLPLAQTFTISHGSADETETIEVELGHDGYVGFGEGTPLDRYDEAPAAGVAFLGDCAEVLGDDPFAFEEIAARLPSTPNTQAARAALDHALHDLCGKLTGLPVWRLLGLPREGPPTCWTVWLGDPDDMARRAELAAPRFQRLKLKLGGRDGLDLERVRAVRAVTELPLQVDVNEYWTVDEALEALPQLAGLGVEYCEQPLPRHDESGAIVKARSPIPIYVDEDCHTLADVAACAERAHGINIKLSKSGGIREAIRMAHAARALGLGVMLGCMTESGLGISAGAQIASLCDFVDLDGNLLLLEDPWPGVELRDGVQLPPNKPGLGVEPIVSLSAERSDGRN
jgi:L-alanine-DL-glutamate epimerase-like enolase superfamily enzyme